jgi:outer membrane protein assembly factor BamB
MRDGRFLNAFLVGTVLAPLVGVACWSHSGFAAELHWPQWRGPFATGAAPAADPPTNWSETQNVRWKVKIPGKGTATPIVWENKVFVQTAIPTGKKVDAVEEPVELPSPAPQDESQDRGGRDRGRGRFGSAPPTDAYQFALLCLDRATGNTLWQATAREEVPHEGHHPDHGFASHSPITDGEHVYAYFGSRGVYCYDLSGNLQWGKDLGRMQTKLSFGEGGSPAIAGNVLVIKWDHEGEDFIVALDKRTGDELWRQSRDEDTSWSSPLIVQHNGGVEVVTAATGRVRSYSLDSGEQVWESEGLTTNAIPSPVAGDGIVYVTSGFRGSKLFAIRLGSRGDVTGTDAILWKKDRSTPYVPSPLLYDGRLYYFSSNNGIVYCYRADTGEPIFENERLEGPEGVYASPVGAGGKVYLVGRNGTSVVIKAGDTFEVLATNVLEDRIDASPAVAGRELFLRGHEHLYCLAEQ